MSTPVSNGKRKINFLDFLLIILVIAIISAAVVTVIRSNPGSISGGDKEIVYTVNCEMLDAGIATMLHIGDNIYDNVTNQLLGSVISVSEPSYITAFDSKGRPFDTDKINITLTLKASVWVEDGAYTIDKYHITAGKTVAFHTDKVSVSGYCSAIRNASEVK
jgi:hypothetical protein